MRNWLTNPTRVGALAYILALAVISTLVLLCEDADADPVEGPPMETQALDAPEEGVDPAVAGVTSQIREFLVRHCRKQPKSRRPMCEKWASRDKRWDRAPDVATLIVEAARARDLDPYLVAVVVEAESSFREGGPDGAVGEKGLMQVHGEALRQALKKGYDMDTAWGQLQAGCDHLAERLEECNGRIQRALAAYQTGSCKSQAGGSERRLRLYKRAKKLFDPEKISE